MTQIYYWWGHCPPRCSERPRRGAHDNTTVTSSRGQPAASAWWAGLGSNWTRVGMNVIAGTQPTRPATTPVSPGCVDQQDCNRHFPCIDKTEDPPGSTKRKMSSLKSTPWAKYTYVTGKHARIQCARINGELDVGDENSSCKILLSRNTYGIKY